MYQRGHESSNIEYKLSRVPVGQYEERIGKILTRRNFVIWAWDPWTMDDRLVKE